MLPVNTLRGVVDPYRPLRECYLLRDSKERLGAFFVGSFVTLGVTPVSFKLSMIFTRLVKLFIRLVVSYIDGAVPR